MPEEINTTVVNQKKSKIQVWMQGVRTFSFPASMIPCVFGIMLALLMSPDNSKWYLIPFIMISLLLLHSASNLMSDYDDFKTGVDFKGSYGGSGVLTDNLLTPKQVFRGS